MWTSSILLIVSLFSARAADFEQGLQSLVDQIWTAQESVSEGEQAAELAPLPSLEVKAAAFEKAPTKVAPAKAAPVVASSEVVVSDLLEPDFDAPGTATSLSALQATMVVSPHLMIKPAPPSKAQEIVGKVQHFYNTTNSFTASFSQTVRNTTFSKLKPKVSSGKVYILKPGKMRWDYKNANRRSNADPKVSKSFISDGKHLWAVMHKNKQFYKESLEGSALPVAVSFLMGTGNLLNDFNVTMETPGKFGSKSDILLLLTPKVPSARYKKLWLVVDPGNFSVKQSVVLNSKGDTNSIVFSKVVLDSGKLQKGHFIFNEAANKDYSLIKPPQD